MAERLSDLARQQSVAKPFRNLSVSQCGARRDRTCNGVDLAIESGRSSISSVTSFKSRFSPHKSATIPSIARCTCAGGCASFAPAKRRNRRDRAAPPSRRESARRQRRARSTQFRTYRSQCRIWRNCRSFRNDSTRRQAPPPDSWSAFMAMRSGFGMGFARPPETKATWTWASTADLRRA